MTETIFTHEKADAPDAKYADGDLRVFFCLPGHRYHVHHQRQVSRATGRCQLQKLLGGGRYRIPFHTADTHGIYMLTGLPKLVYDGVKPLVEAGDCAHQRPGIAHSLMHGRTTWSLWRSSCRAILR
jgi:quercetin dioxygenase-like cupin family protein